MNAKKFTYERDVIFIEIEKMSKKNKSKTLQNIYTAKTKTLQSILDLSSTVDSYTESIEHIEKVITTADSLIAREQVEEITDATLCGGKEYKIIDIIGDGVLTVLIINELGKIEAFSSLTLDLYFNTSEK